ncbi:phosphoenolpyruvate hydrolase family protein [Clostridium sp. ATCC 25772]|uniref:phosphoenolpyruvate hydrolase family protein n=1 Tax=Clostridium sp. ATCC 25772 TaxID=1676991 RepID=UPI0007866676|nr:phosphoenolpyruvate hydrolase family protein [Clostridium sp. ATCC 25772]
MKFTREVILERLNKEIKNENIILGAGAGTGISAKSAEAGGVDMIIIYNSGRYRMAGRGSLAGLLSYGDANQIVMDMGKEVLPVVKNTPVLAGVCGTDPFRIMEVFLKELKDSGFAGVQNFPTVGLIDGTFRENLEETGMGYDLEVEMIRKAHEIGLFTTPYVFDKGQAIKMAEAGADILVAHMGLTTKGSIGAKTSKSLDECVELIQTIHDEAKKINPNILVICHGGPIAEASDVEYVLSKTKGIVGFFGASSIERLATERGIKNQTESFKNLKL